MLSAVIFDFDGVIVDTMDAHFKTWKRLAYFLGFELPNNTKDLMRGASRDKSLQVVLDYGNIEASSNQKKFYAHMKDTWFQYEISQMNTDHICPGVLKLLDQLKESNIKTAVASASKNATHILDQLGLSSSFDTIMDANDIILSKPDPSVFIAVLEKLHTKAKEAVVIEDGVMGVKAAKAAEIKCIGIGSQALLAEADFVISDLNKLSLNEIEGLLANNKQC